ncbi:MAG: T9SS type A sorting domain-containing protein [Bacteroidetes bacterium]|nr:T9SS type A sorting domain-containing protein [Bacteroidota bacterium]
MKKLLLLAILALSISVFAQSKRPDNHIQPPSRHSLHDNQRINEDHGLKLTGVCSKMNPLQPISHQTPDPRELVQIWDSIYNFQWDTLTNGWQPEYKYADLVYNTNNYLTSYLGLFWNGNAWVNASKASYTYNEYNLETSFLSQSWDGTAWVNANQYLYTYDAHNNLTNRIFQHWTSGAWINNDQYVSTFDASNNLTSQLRQTWSSGVWTNAYQNLNTYDANNNRTGSLSQNWTGSVWLNSYQILYTFNADNFLTNKLTQNWNGIAWVDANDGVYNYDANNNLMSYFEQYWNGSVWENSLQYFCTYDVFYNLTRQTGQYWIGNTWVNSYQNGYTYDANNFIKSETSRYWNDAGNLTYGDSTYYFSHAVMGTNDRPAQEGNISVYPNPTHGKFTINCSKTISSIEIFNTPGERICDDQKFNLQTSKEIDLSGCDRGIYLVKIVIGDKRYIKKIVIQ